MSDEVTVKKVQENNRMEVKNKNVSIKRKKGKKGSTQRKSGKRKHTQKVLKK